MPLFKTNGEQTNLQELLGPERPEMGGLWSLMRLLLVMFLVLIVGYAGLKFGYKAFLRREIAQREAAIAELGERIPQAEQEQFLRFYSQLVDVKQLLETHAISSRAFAFLEANTHVGVFFSGANLTVGERKLSLQGTAVSRDAFVEQLTAWSGMREVASYKITETSLQGERVRFGVNLFLAPEVFKL